MVATAATAADACRMSPRKASVGALCASQMGGVLTGKWCLITGASHGVVCACPSPCVLFSCRTHGFLVIHMAARQNHV